MSVEQKIRELMSNKSSTESKRLDEATLGADLVNKDQTIKAATRETGLLTPVKVRRQMLHMRL